MEILLTAEMKIDEKPCTMAARVYTEDMATARSMAIIAFTVYTMRMGTSSVLEIKIERKQLGPVD